MSDYVVNLRSFRKSKARTEKEVKAQGNRQKFGRTKLEKDAAKSEAERNRLNLEGARRDGNEE